jgi:hypothetical protein
MAKPIRISLLLALLAAGPGACSSGTTTAAPESPDPNAGPSARIINQSSIDQDISVYRSAGPPIPLGRVPAGATASFAIGPGITTGSSSIRFEARPVRGSGESVVSEPFTIRAGEPVTWSIPAQ